MIEFLFIDLDDTILDFHMAEQVALSKTLRFFGLEPDEQVIARYSQINREHWERLERKELTREEVLVGRFQVLFREYGLTVDPVQCARTYEGNLSQGHYFLPGAREAVESLSKSIGSTLPAMVRPGYRPAGWRAQISPISLKRSLCPRRWAPTSRISYIFSVALPRSPILICKRL
jgi:beta-phosphoglucomutase-like phosphatase (HAD superfamily)